MATYIGSAGWTVPSRLSEEFPISGSHLERYAARFHCVEINTSFHRPHLFETYQRWAEVTPPDFRFSVKLAKSITHNQRLIDVESQLEIFLKNARGLGEKLGPILVQLPPSLRFHVAAVRPFFDATRTHPHLQFVCEPRHETWFSDAADTFLAEYSVARVAADPACCFEASIPGGFMGMQYWRLHGSPQVYYSRYDSSMLEALADRFHVSNEDGHTVWCIFDNTALGHATENALELDARLCSVLSA